MEKLQQVLGALSVGLKSDGNWLRENHRRELEAHDAILAAAEGALEKALAFVRSERRLLRPADDNIARLETDHGQRQARAVAASARVNAAGAN